MKDSSVDKDKHKDKNVVETVARVHEAANASNAHCNIVHNSSHGAKKNAVILVHQYAYDSSCVTYEFRYVGGLPAAASKKCSNKGDYRHMDGGRACSE